MAYKEVAEGILNIQWVADQLEKLGGASGFGKAEIHIAKSTLDFLNTRPEFGQLIQANAVNYPLIIDESVPYCFMYIHHIQKIDLEREKVEFEIAKQRANNA